MTPLRLKPRFGAPKNLNDVTLNFDYNGQMICELQIKIGTGVTPLLYKSNHLLYEVERVCASMDPYMLFEVYTKTIGERAKEGLTTDSTMVNESLNLERENLDEVIDNLSLHEALHIRDGTYDDAFNDILVLAYLMYPPSGYGVEKNVKDIIAEMITD